MVNKGDSHGVSQINTRWMGVNSGMITLTGPMKVLVEGVGEGWGERRGGGDGV